MLRNGTVPIPPLLLQQVKECSALLHALRCEVEAKVDWLTTPLASACVSLLSVVQRLVTRVGAESVCVSTVREAELMECDTCLAHTLQCFTGVMECGSSDDSLGNERLWIVKPVALSCGEGITVQQGIHAVIQAVLTLNYKCVVQKYIERPLLLRHSQKFDIRQWALVTSVNPLVIFGFSECYIRLSSRPYSTDVSTLHHSLVHLCNQSIQGTSSSHTSEGVEECEYEYECDTMMSQSEFDMYLRQINTSEFATQYPGRLSEVVASGKPFTYASVILPQVRVVCVEAVERVRDRLQRVGKGFEWLGFDVMVTHSLHVRLIEVNVSPDTTASTVITTRLVSDATSDLFRVVLDEGAVWIKRQYYVTRSHLKCTLIEYSLTHLHTHSHTHSLTHHVVVIVTMTPPPLLPHSGYCGTLVICKLRVSCTHSLTRSFTRVVCYE